MTNLHSTLSKKRPRKPCTEGRLSKDKKNILEIKPRKKRNDYIAGNGSF